MRLSDLHSTQQIELFNRKNNHILSDTQTAYNQLLPSHRAELSLSQKGYSNEGIVDSIKNIISKFKSNKEELLKEEKEYKDYTTSLESMESTINDLRSRIDKTKKPLDKFVNVSSLTFNALTRNNNQNEYIEGLRQYADLINDRSTTPPLLLLTKKYWPKIEAIINHNSDSIEGLVDSYSEIRKQKILDPDIIIRECMSVFKPTSKAAGNKYGDIRYLSVEEFLGSMRLETVFFINEDKIIDNIGIELKNSDYNRKLTKALLKSLNTDEVDVLLDEVLKVIEASKDFDQYARKIKPLNPALFENVFGIMEDAYPRGHEDFNAPAELYHLAMILYMFDSVDGLDLLGPQYEAWWRARTSIKAAIIYANACIKNLR